MLVSKPSMASHICNASDRQMQPASIGRPRQNTKPPQIHLIIVECLTSDSFPYSRAIFALCGHFLISVCR